jgi:beta-glucanase (GH16 family)
VGYAGQGLTASNADLNIVGGNKSNLQTNFFGKGNNKVPNRFQNVPNPSHNDNVQEYGIEYTPNQVVWYIQGSPVRVLNKADTNADDRQFPASPMRIAFSVWCGGIPGTSEGTMQWAGGPTDLSAAPFNMTVQSVEIEDYSKGTTTYSYTGHTGNTDTVTSGTGNIYSQNSDIVAVTDSTQDVLAASVDTNDDSGGSDGSALYAQALSAPLDSAQSIPVGSTVDSTGHVKNESGGSIGELFDRPRRVCC